MTKRRNILKAGATGVAATLAGCINPGNDTTNTTDDNETDDTSTDNTTDNTTNSTDDNTNDTDDGTNNTNDDNPQDDSTMEATVDATITLNNQSTSAWVVSSVDGTTQESIQTGESNTSIQLFEGNRYRFVNNGGSFHPLAFRDSDGTVLLSESGSGEFEDDSNVNWVDGDGSVEFTVTSELADRLNEYYCTVHGPMVGSVETSTAP